MTDQELDRRLAQAVSHTAPNDLDTILSRFAHRSGRGSLPSRRGRRV